MSRPKQIINRKLVLEAKKQLTRFENHHMHLHLLAIIKAGDLAITEIAHFFKVSRDTHTRRINLFGKEGIKGLMDKPEGHDPSKLGEGYKRISIR